ncbi:hypothetical protein J3R82DRAFT_8543 [Butyriboletus roseoflavus]|nr:hypothetical protein J3R82DRAFT_8543 [Butyriboletus roseoflavus]
MALTATTSSQHRTIHLATEENESLGQKLWAVSTYGHLFSWLCTSHSVAMSLQQFGKGALRVAKNYTLRFSDTQTKVRDATSNALWGPSGTDESHCTVELQSVRVVAPRDARMRRTNFVLLNLSHRNNFVDIMEMLDKRLNDKGKNWRHVFKASV